MRLYQNIDRISYFVGSKSKGRSWSKFIIKIKYSTKGNKINIEKGRITSNEKLFASAIVIVWEIKTPRKLMPNHNPIDINIKKIAILLKSNL